MLQRPRSERQSHTTWARQGSRSTPAQIRGISLGRLAACQTSSGAFTSVDSPPARSWASSAPFKFADGSKKPAYVVSDDAAGFRYPVSAAYLAKTICDAATKKRVNKLPAPRAVARRV